MTRYYVVFNDGHVSMPYKTREEASAFARMWIATSNEVDSDDLRPACIVKARKKSIFRPVLSLEWEYRF
jgi:hypothetical protein